MKPLVRRLQERAIDLRPTSPDDARLIEEAIARILDLEDQLQKRTEPR